MSTVTEKIKFHTNNIIQIFQRSTESVIAKKDNKKTISKTRMLSEYILVVPELFCPCIFNLIAFIFAVRSLEFNKTYRRSFLQQLTSEVAIFKI